MLVVECTALVSLTTWFSSLLNINYGALTKVYEDPISKENPIYHNTDTFFNTH